MLLSHAPVAGRQQLPLLTDGQPFSQWRSVGFSFSPPCACALGFPTVELASHPFNIYAMNARKRPHEGLPAMSRRPSHGFTKAFPQCHEGLRTDSRRPSHGFTKAFPQCYEGLRAIIGKFWLRSPRTVPPLFSNFIPALRALHLPCMNPNET